MSERTVELAAIFEDFPLEVFSPLPVGLTVTGVTADSRQVKPGFLFVAQTGETNDGHRFIPQALERGAVVVVGTQPLGALYVPYVQISDTRAGLAYLAAGYYGCPAHHLTVIGVTGTDGKTTTCNLIFQVLRAAGLKAGMISTVNAVIGDQVLDTGFHVTTPEAPDVQRYLAQMVAAGLSHVVLEVTSHGLAQHRVDACEFDYGVVTNITHEHLDYHGTYEAYRAAKGRLFEELGRTPQKAHQVERAAILNRDDSSFNYLQGVSQVRTVSYGLHPEADVRAEGAGHSPEGLFYTALGPGFRLPIRTHLAGGFNVSNSLAAAALALVGMRLPPEAVQTGLFRLEGVPGRMERIDLGQAFTAIVDFAHTPNALRVALSTARQMLQEKDGQGRVIAVFGSAGLRDRMKRRMMAEVSGELADLTVLTAEDPRTEKLEDILAEMAAGVEAKGGVEGKTFWRIADRGEAIRQALRLARPGDIVLACGKGHEQSMCFGEVEYAWDDRTAMQAALAELLGEPGPAMPYLPTQAAG